MPVTAKLSLRFYEKLGEDVANELAEWFNSVDATYRSDLRELNELNFARFDAKLEQRLAQFEAKLERRLAELKAEMDRRFAQVDARFETLEARLVQRIESRIAAVKQSLLRWMFASWCSLMLVLLGMLFALLEAR
jgi:exonuclease VII large subunit